MTANGTELAVAPSERKLIGDKDHLDEDKSSLTAAPLSIVAKQHRDLVTDADLWKDVNNNR